MSIIYSTRSIPTTSYNLTRLGGEYLLDWNGDYILDSNSERIIVIVPGGYLPLTPYSTYRNYVLTQLGEITGTLGDMEGILADYYTGLKPTTYSTR